MKCSALPYKDRLKATSQHEQFIHFKQFCQLFGPSDNKRSHRDFYKGTEGQREGSAEGLCRAQFPQGLELQPLWLWPACSSPVSTAFSFPSCSLFPSTLPRIIFQKHNRDFPFVVESASGKSRVKQVTAISAIYRTWLCPGHSWELDMRSCYHCARE